MTQEKGKELLLKDLSARLSYEIHCCILNLDKTIKEENDIIYGIVGDNIVTLKSDKNECYMYYQIKPYLRPVSSMTKEEKEEVEVLIFGEWFAQDSGKVDGEGWIEILANYDVSGIDPGFCSDYIDWLNAHHFDYRGLIPMDLALEAPDDMYK